MLETRRGNGVRINVTFSLAVMASAKNGESTCGRGRQGQNKHSRNDSESLEDCWMRTRDECGRMGRCIRKCVSYSSF